LTGRRITTLNVVGGGSRSELLNQLTADACGIGVEAGPTEATALGNVGVQSAALGGLTGLEELRALVRRSFGVRRFSPGRGVLTGARDRFEGLPVE
jgi:rhamnulokinase